MRAKLTRSRSQKIALMFPVIREVLSNKKFIEELAKHGCKVDIDALQSLQVECFTKAHTI